MFYTRSNGVRVPATLVGFAPDGLVHLEYFRDAVKVVNRQCKVKSISFAIPSADSPPPHFPYLVTHFTDAMPISSIGGALSIYYSTPSMRVVCRRLPWPWTTWVTLCGYALSYPALVPMLRYGTP